MIEDDEPHSDRRATLTAQTGAATLRTGDLLAARYRIEETTGVGAAGVVYRAWDERLDVAVAVKILHSSVARDAAAMQRFESELRLARQVTHPNVVRIHDIGEHEHLTFLTMDFVAGRSLGDLIALEGKLTPERVARIARDIAAGLAAAHANGVVHRDLKPANILIDDQENALITDFGVARSLATAHMTRTGLIVGTPDYLAPEQARGEEVDERADIYALGLIVYEALAGKPPFDAGTLDELIAQRTLGRAPNLAAPAFDAPEYLRRVVRRCLERRPEDRYADASEIVAELDSGHSPRPLLRKARTAAVIAIVVVLAGLAAAVWLRQPAVTDSPPTMVASPVSQVTFAILPFVSATSDPALAWISTGAAEALTADLAVSGNLNVVSRQRVRTTLADLRIDGGVPAVSVARQLADLFGADWIIAGSITVVDGQVRIEPTMTAVDPAQDRRTLPPVVAELADVASLGGEIGAAIRNNLSLPRPARAPDRLSNNLAALRAYATGVELQSRGDSVGAVEPLERAVGEDATFTAAWLKLAEAYRGLGRDGEALNAVNKAINQSVDARGRVVQMARVLQAELDGDYERASTFLRDYLVAEPGDGEVRLRLAEITGDGGHFSAAIEMLLKLVDDDPNHPRAWFLLGKYAIQNGDSQRALNEFLVKALAIQEKINNRQGRADVLNAMGIAQHRVGQLTEAQTSYAQAAEIRKDIDDRRGFASSLANLARIQLRLGQYDDSRASVEEAIKVRREIGDQPGVASALNIYGVLEEEIGNFPAALRQYRQALKIREETGNRRALGNSYTNIAFVYFVLGEYDNAGVYWQRALEEAIETDNPDAQMLARQSLGQLKLAQGDWAAALELFLDTLDFSRQSGYPDAEAVALGNLGRVAQRQGRYSAALLSYADALAILAEIGDLRGQIEFALWRAEALLDLRDADGAALDLERVVTWLDQSGNDEQRARLAALSGTLAAQRGDADRARTAFETALAAAGRTGGDVAALEVMVARAEALQPESYLTPGELGTLVTTVRELGNADLSLRVLALATKSALATGDAEAASARTQELLALLGKHQPYAGAWRIHLLASQSARLSAQQPAASRQQHEAVADLQRLLRAMPAAARTGFLAQPELEGISVE